MNPKSRDQAEVVKLFARKVRSERKRREWSQEDLAAVSGLHRTYIGGLERCEINATLANADRVARAFDMELAELLVE